MSDLSHLSFEEVIKTEFILPYNFIDRCEFYFLRKWSVGYFLDQMDWNPMSVTYEGVEYKLVFVDNLKWRSEWTQVFLSFRKPVNPEVPAYVLVKGFKERT